MFTVCPLTSVPLDSPNLALEDRCPACGSISARLLLARLVEGTVTVIPLNSAYTVRLRNRWGDSFTHILRDPDNDETQITISEEAEFQFCHFSPAQMDVFIDLYNHRALHMAVPGYFPVLPYFATLAPPGNTPSQQDGS